MSKLTLTSIGAGTAFQTAIAPINDNNNSIVVAIENTLSRDGTSPNQMAASLDMNSNQILNLPQPATANSPLRLQDLNDFVGGGTVTNIPAGGAAGAPLIKSSGTDYDVEWETIIPSIQPGSDAGISYRTTGVVSAQENVTFTGTGVYPLSVVTANPIIVGHSGITIGSSTVGQTFGLRFQWSTHDITKTYTAVSGDTTTTIATALTALIMADTTLHGTSDGLPIFAQSFGNSINVQYTHTLSATGSTPLTLTSTGTGTINVPAEVNVLDFAAFQIGRNVPSRAVNGDSLYSLDFTGRSTAGFDTHYAQLAVSAQTVTSGSQQGRFTLSVANNGNTADGVLYAERGLVLYNSSGTAATGGDKGFGSINLPSGATSGIFFDGADQFYKDAGAASLILTTSDKLAISGSGGVGINTTPTGNAFVSGLGAFISGLQTPTTGSGISLTGGATPVITARNYGTSTTLPLDVKHTILSTGANGSTNPAFQVDASASSIATGIKIAGAAAGSRTALSVISSGTNEGIDIDAKGSGTIRLGNTSTGAITLQRATTVNSSLTTTGQLTVSYGSANLTLQDTGTSFAYFQIIGSGGGTPVRTRIGTDSTAGGSLLGGTSANATVVGSIDNNKLQFGTNNAVTLTLHPSGGLALGSGLTGTDPGAGAFQTAAGITAGGAVTVTSSSASALTVGLNGATNPVLKIDASTASQAAGLSVKGAATGGTVAIAAIDSGSNTNITIDGKGTGTIGIGSVSTGAVTITPATNVVGVLTAASTTATPAGGSSAAKMQFGTTSGLGIYYGSGAPTVSAAQGSIYIRTDGSSTSTRLYVNTNGSTTWTNVTTAA